MATKKINPKKEILQQDSIFLFWERTQRFIQENIRQMGAVGLVILVILGGVGIWTFKGSKAEEQAAALLYSAMKIYNGETDTTPGDTATQSPGAVDYNQALEKFKEVNSQFPDQEAGLSSLFYVGSCNFNLGNYEDAITNYKDFLVKIGNDNNILRSFAYEGLGYAYEEKGEYNKALEWFAKQKNEKDSALNMLSLINLARCYEEAGDKQQSCKAYREFVDTYPTSSFEEIAKIKITELCNKYPPVIQ